MIVTDTSLVLACLTLDINVTRSHATLQVLPVALLCALFHGGLPVRELHMAAAGVHAADLRVSLHIQLRSHLQHHVT